MEPYVEWKPKYNPWAVALTVTLATFMEVLDTSIANVSLPHIAGNLSVSEQESTWVLTSYLVSNAIILPISAWFSRLMGRKRFYMMCVALFTLSSFLCGLAPSLGVLVACRILQGAGGGGLQPSEQSILADTFPAAKRGMAFAVYGMAVVVAPAIGPTLGGWITDNYSWRWIFYINVPIGLLSLYLSHKLVEDPPYLVAERAKGRPRIDFPGLGMLVIGIGCLQVVLDKGQEKDWFSTTWITVLFCIAIYTLIAWVVWEYYHPSPIVEIRLFRNRNFSTAMFFTFVLGIVLFGTTVVIPQFLQLLMGYSAVKAGEAMAGGGFMMLLMMPIAGQLVSRVDPRGMMCFGFLATAASLYYMATHLSLQMDFGTAAMLRTYQTIGLAFIFLPSSILAYVGTPRQKNNQISAMNSFVRNIGGSIGIALISTLLTRQAQKHQVYMASHTDTGAMAFRQMANGMAQSLAQKGVAHPQQQAYERIGGLITGQATTLAYIDIITTMAIAVALLAPFVMIMRRPKPGGPGPRLTKMHPLIDFHNVTVQRGERYVLDGLTLGIAEGEHVAILGPNGSGKSTLIKLISRELYPRQKDEAWRAQILGRDRWHLFELRNQLGLVSNDWMQMCTRDYSGYEIVLSGFFGSVGIWPNHHVTSEMEQKAREVLELLEVTHLAERNTLEMSSGEARRILIGRALVHAPRALILDEPTNSLDLHAEHGLRQILRKLAASGISLLMVTHHLPDIIPEMERVVMIRNGCVHYDGPKREGLTAQRLSELFSVPLEVVERAGHYHVL